MTENDPLAPLLSSGKSPKEIAEAIGRLLNSQGPSGNLDLSMEAVKEFEASYAVAETAKFFESVT